MKKKTKTTRKASSTAKKKKTSSTRKKTSVVAGPRKSDLAESIYMTNPIDPAHSPGHRKMNLKDSARAEKRGPKNRMTRADKVQRTSATNRRIITGAALGKTGQITLK